MQLFVLAFFFFFLSLLIGTLVLIRFSKAPTDRSEP